MAEEQEQPQIRSTPYMSPMHQFAGSIEKLTNPEGELDKMELTFRNVRINAEGMMVSAGQPLMNDYGINSVIGTVQSLVNQITVMSNLNKQEIPMLIDFLGDTLARDLMINRVPYGIHSFSARDKIFFTSLSTAFVTLKRAYEEGDKRFWKGSQQEITTRVEGAARQNKGMFGRFMGWGNK